MESVNKDPGCRPLSGKPSLRHLRLITLNLWHAVYSFLGQSPKIFRLLVRMGLVGSELMDERTELVIEGFPRSGNTFAVTAFEMAQPRPVLVAHHSHNAVRVMLAGRKGIPTLVLVRRPEDAVLSLVIRDSSLSIKQALGNYIRFYTRIKPDYRGYVVARFDDVTRNFGEVIDRINQRFGTAFSVFEHNEKNVGALFRLAEDLDLYTSGRSQVSEATVARPSRERERTKAVLRRELEKEDVKYLLAKVQALYRDFTAQPS